MIINSMFTWSCNNIAPFFQTKNKGWNILEIVFYNQSQYIIAHWGGFNWN